MSHKQQSIRLLVLVRIEIRIQEFLKEFSRRRGGAIVRILQSLWSPSASSYCCYFLIISLFLTDFFLVNFFYAYRSK